MKQLFLTLCLFGLTACLTLLNAQYDSVIQLPNSGTPIYSFTTSDDGQILYYVNDNTFTKFNVMDRAVTETFDLKVTSPVISLVAHAPSNTIFLGTQAGQLVAISNETGQFLFSIDHKAGSLNALALTSDERFLLCGYENGKVFRLSIEDKEEVIELYQHRKTITSIAVSQERQLIAISSGDGTISLFREPAYEWIGNLVAGTDWVRKIVINEAKDRLLSVGDDGYLHEWDISDINNARLLHSNRESKNWILSLDIVPGGDAECWGGLDHTLKVRTHFGYYRKKLKGPILQAEFISSGTSEVLVATCLLGKGIQIIPLKTVKFNTTYK